MKINKCALVIMLLSGMALTVGVPPASAAANGSAEGIVFAGDLKNPISGAVITLRNIKTAGFYASAPTGADGLFAFSAVDEGRYVVEITVAEGNFIDGHGLTVKANETAELVIGLKRAIEPVVGEMTGMKRTAEFAVPADPEESFDDPVIGDTDLDPSIIAAARGCIHRPPPPKPPKSRHKRHQWRR